jgi:parallel beta-helix repeat protein
LRGAKSLRLRKNGSLHVNIAPPLKLRPLKNNRDGVSNVLGYTFSISIAAILMVSAIFIFNGVIDDKTDEVAKIEAQNIANYVANSIAEAVSIKETMPEANYYKTLDLPERIAGKKYTIEVTETEVFVRTADGNVIESCSTYSVEGRDSGIVPSIIRNKNDGLRLSYDEMDYIFKFDFGKGNILSHSPVEAGYYMVSPEIGPDWYSDLPFRIPINITNPSNKYMDETPVKIVLNDTNFDYDHVTFSPGNNSGQFGLGGDGIPQPNFYLYDPELSIDNEINISASIDPPTWYPHWRYSRININNSGPFDDPDDIMEIEKETFRVILTFENDPEGPNSEYVWYDALDEPPLHPIRFGPAVGDKIDCISYTPNYGDPFVGMAEFTFDDAFTTIPFFERLSDGSTQEIEIEGYFLDKTKFYTTCNITMRYGDIYVKKGSLIDTIQGGIDIAVPDSGQTIFVHPGTYDEKIFLNKNNINLVGNSLGEDTIIDGFGFEDFVVNVTEDNIIISSLKIINGATGDGYDQTDGLELFNCSNVIVTNCEIRNNHGRGIVIHGGANMNIVRKCSSLENKGARVMDELQDGDGLVITDDTEEGTEYNYVLDSEFKNCNNFDTDGIVLSNGADFNKIENCVINNIGGSSESDWSKGIEIVTTKEGTKGPSNNVIKNCHISDVSGKYISGIGIWNDPLNNGQNNPTNNRIIGGNIFSIKGLGIALYNSDNNKISDVTIHDNFGGIWTLDSDNNLIENCKIYGNKDNTFTFNPFLPESKSTGDGIYFDLFSDFNTVRNCDIHNNEGVGIYIADVNDANSDNITIENCNIYNNKGNLIKNGAILLSFTSNTVIKNCNIYDNLRNGISIYFSDETLQNNSQGNHIINNNIFNNGKNGILFLAGTRYNNISHNSLYWNKGYGVKIEVLGGGYNYINNNNFANNVDGQAYDLTLTNDDWSKNYWEGHNISKPFIIPPILEQDPTPQNIISSEIIILDGSGVNLSNNIQDAINNASINAIIKVSGIYSITNPIVIDKPLKLIGKSARIVYNGLDSAIKIQSNGVEIDSFDIRGPSRENGNGILITDGDSVIINNCKIHSFFNGIHIQDNGVRITNCRDIYSNTNGILINGFDNNQIINCNFYNNKDGIEILNYGTEIPNNNIIIESDFEDNEINGIHLNGADLNTIEYCTFEGNEICGILINGMSLNNEIKKCMIIDNGCGVSIKMDSELNSIYHNHFELNSENGNDENPAITNFWDDTVSRGNYWDDYFGLDTDYDGIGDDTYVNGVIDNYPISAAGRYIESLLPYSVEYWNPSGESIILANIDLKPKQSKIIYLYYGFEEMHSLGGTGLEAVAVEPLAFKKYTEDNCVFYENDFEILYNIPTLEPPDPKAGEWTKNEIMYVVESRFRIEDLSENQANIILLSQDQVPPLDFDNSYIISINNSFTKGESPQPNNDFYFHKNPSQVLFDSSSLPKSMNNWLFLKSFIYISKNYFNENPVNFVNISTFIYDYDTYTTLGSSSIYELDSTDAYLDGYIGIGCGLLGDISNGKIIVDWVRVRKEPLSKPMIKIGAMESRNNNWITSYHLGEDIKIEGNIITPFKPGPLLRDSNCGSIFGIENLPRGRYTITVTSGDFEQPRAPMNVYIDPDYTTNPPTARATIFFPPTTKEREFETRSTTFDWPGGLLELGFSGCDCDPTPGENPGGGIVNAITIAKGQKGIRLSYG